jgi:hypothetical protein
MIKQEKTEKKVLDLSAKNQSLWLVKVPKEVAESWSKKQSDDLLGSLSITTVSGGPGAPPVKKINVSLTGSSSSGSGSSSSSGGSEGAAGSSALGGAAEVEEFTLEELSNNERQLLAFRLNETSHTFAVQGQVTKNLVLRPKETKQYREKVRQRTINATTRQETQMATEEEVEMQRTIDRTVDFIPPAHAELKRKAQESSHASKVGRATAVFNPGELQRKVIAAFHSGSDYHKLKDLLVICKDVPGIKEKDLKDCLASYARYHEKGDLKGYWELKMEYKNHAAKK